MSAAAGRPGAPSSRSWRVPRPTRSCPSWRRGLEEPVIVKAFPSGFVGTNLLAYLVYHGVDTLIVTGAVTSGCVRDTVVLVRLQPQLSRDRARGGRLRPGGDVPQGDALRYPHEVRRRGAPDGGTGLPEDGPVLRARRASPSRKPRRADRRGRLSDPDWPPRPDRGGGPGWPSRPITSWRRAKSTLPPLSTAATIRPLWRSARPARSAATAAAPAPSTRSFARWRSPRIASRISSSDTATRSSTYRPTVATTRSLVVGDESPSAMLGVRLSHCGLPAATESCTSRPGRHSTPTTRTSGRLELDRGGDARDQGAPAHRHHHRSPRPGGPPGSRRRSIRSRRRGPASAQASMRTAPCCGPERPRPARTRSRGRDGGRPRRRSPAPPGSSRRAPSRASTTQHAHAGLARGVGHALGQVARGHDDDAAPLLLGAQLRDPVDPAARLVGAGLLEVLALDVEAHAASGAETLPSTGGASGAPVPG